MPAAVMRPLAGMWATRIDALDPQGGLDAERVAEEGVRAAGHLLRMVLQALDYLPPVELDGPVQRLTSNFINGVNHLPLRWPAA